MARTAFQPAKGLGAGVGPETAAEGRFRSPGGAPGGGSARGLAAGEGFFEKNDELVAQAAAVGHRQADQLPMEAHGDLQSQVLRGFVLSDLHTRSLAEVSVYVQSETSWRNPRTAVSIISRPTSAARLPHAAGPHLPTPLLEVDQRCTWSSS